MRPVNMLDEWVVQSTYWVRQFDPESLQKVVFSGRRNRTKQASSKSAAGLAGNPNRGWSGPGRTTRWQSCRHGARHADGERISTGAIPIR